MENNMMLLITCMSMVLIAFSAFVTMLCATKPKEPILPAVISSVVQHLRELSFEEEVAISNAGEIIARTTQYSPDFVEQTDSQTAMFRERGDVISMHNHVDDIPPSIQDLSYAAKANFQWWIVVTPHWVYHISRPESGWKTESELVAVVNRHQTLLKTKMVGVPEVTVESDGAVVVAKDIEILMTDQALTAICQDLGYPLSKKATFN